MHFSAELMKSEEKETVKTPVVQSVLRTTRCLSEEEAEESEIVVGGQDVEGAIELVREPSH